MLLLETFLASFTALILFSLVVKPKRYDTTLSHLLGFGILLPFWIATPVYMIRLFEIRNMLFKFMFGVVVPTISIFRSTEGKVNSLENARVVPHQYVLQLVG